MTLLFTTTNLETKYEFSGAKYTVLRSTYTQKKYLRYTSLKTRLKELLSFPKKDLTGKAQQIFTLILNIISKDHYTSVRKYLKNA